MSASRLSQGMSGMAADGAGRRARRIEQHGVERPGLPFGHVGRDHLGGEAQPRQIVAQRASSRFAERSTAVTRAPAAQAARSCRRAPRRDRRSSCPRTSPKQPRRQRRGGVLHPPGALVDSRAAARRGRARRCARVPVGSTRPRRRCAQCSGIALHREIERRLVARARPRWRGRSPRRNVAVQRAHQPGRRVERDRYRASRELRFAFARDPPQHRVDETRNSATRRSACASRTDRSTAA